MRIRVYNGHQAPGYIAECRKKVCAAVGISPDSPAAELTPFASYLLLSDNGVNIGMAEACNLDQCYADWDASPYKALLPSPPCPFEYIAGIRSVFIEPDRRDRGRAFLLTYLAAAYVFYQRGARFATCNTWIERTDLQRLYRRMGARHLGTTVISDSPPVAAFLFDLAGLLEHPIAKESIEALEDDSIGFSQLREPELVQTRPVPEFPLGCR